MKDLLKKIWNEIKDFFTGIEPELKAAIAIGATVTDRLNQVIQTPVADLITDLIKGDWDDKIKDMLREALPKIVVELKLAQKCAGLTDPNAIVQCAMEELKQLSGDYKSAFLHDLSIIIAQVAADGKLSWSDGVYVLQWYYEHHKAA